MNTGNERQHEAAPGMRSDTLADGIFILLAFAVVQRSVGFVRSILFCRWLDPGQLGEWDMAFGFLMLAAPLSVLALSSSFPRYLEHYRRQGDLRRFLARTTIAYVLLGGASVSLVFFARPWVSALVFGTSDRADLVAQMAVCLAAVIAHHYFLDLFGAFRNARWLAGIQMVNGLLFAGVGLALLGFRRCEASSVVIAFGVACAVCAVLGTIAARRAWPTLAQAPASNQPLAVWTKILPYLGWVSLTNLMGAMFDVTDRYMIIHFSAFSPPEALQQVGLYHSCRVVPLLLVSVAATAGSIITPHLSHEWETGRRDRVSMMIQMLLKLFSFSLAAACVAILYAAPLLFGVAFQGKFEGAMAILPWTLAYCCWFALFALLQNYAWCCEKGYMATAALASGVVLNIGLNLILLPRMGLFGAVLATATANIVALAILFFFCRRLGLRVERSTWVAVALPICVCLGPWLATVVLAAVALQAATGRFLLNADEKRRIADGVRLYTERVAAVVSASRSRRSANQQVAPVFPAAKSE